MENETTDQFGFPIQQNAEPSSADPPRQLSVLDAETFESAHYVNGAILCSWLGIAVAAGIGAVGLLLAGFVALLVENGLPTYTFECILAFCFFLIVAAIAFVFTAVFTVCITSFSVILVIFFNWTQGTRLLVRQAVSMTGSLTGFIATLPVSFGVAEDVFARTSIELPIPIIVLLPFAMVMGHLGAVWSVHRNTPWNEILASESQRSRPPFQIFHMFVLMTWFGSIFGFARARGGVTLLLCLTIGLVCQLLILAVDHYWMKLYLSNSKVGQGSDSK